MKFKPLATNFHGHADIGSLDGASTAIFKLINASEQNRPTDCLTDHGSLSGIADHYFAAEKIQKDKKITNKVKSIHGCEFYVIDWNRPYKEYKNGKKEPKYYHITIHFKTQRAYQYFCSLTPIMEQRAIVKYGETKPLITLDELRVMTGEITVGSSCMVGCVGANILAGRSDWAEENYLILRELAGPGNFFVEVMPHEVTHNWKKAKKDKESGRIIEPGVFIPATQRIEEGAIDLPFQPDDCTGCIDLQKPINEFMIKMAKKYGDPVIISLDDHFAKPEDKVVQNTRLGNGDESWRFYNSLHACDSEECATTFKRQLGSSDRDIEEWIDNGYQFIELFKDYKFLTAKDQALLPRIEDIYEVKPESSTVKLYELIAKHGKMPKEDEERYPIYKQRLEYEISVLRDNGKFDLLNYFFIIEDLVGYLRSVGSTNAARGSAAGSIIAYLLNISIADPIVYKLSFERFLTLGRILGGSLPDIDLDIDNRDIAIEYLRKKYGDKIALISTNMQIKLKYAIKDTERSELGVVEHETERMCKLIPNMPQGVTNEKWLFGYRDESTGAHIDGIFDLQDEGSILLRDYAKNNPKRWEVILKTIGITRSKGVHAGGVVITPGPIANYVPVINTNQGFASAYEMKTLEAIGGIKYDLLGLDTLWALGISLKELKKDGVADISWGEFPHDVNVFREILYKDKLAGVFQLNTKLVRPFLKKVMPKSISDISAITSLARPGSLDAAPPNPNFNGTAADYFVAVAQNKEKPYFIHPELKEILEPTYGVIIYQEQQMAIAKLVLGLSDAEADEFRRATGKKDKDLVDKNVAKLREGCLGRGYTGEQTETLCSAFLAAAKYSFNASHAVSYSIIAYNCCYLKYHHPLYFWKGILTVFQDDFKKIADYLPECSEYIGNINVLISDKFEWKIHEGKLIPPLSFVKGIGDKGVDTVLNLLKEAGLRNG